MHTRIPLIIVISALLVFGLLVFFGARIRVRQIADRLPAVLETELQTRLNRKASIHSVRLVSINTAIVDGIAIANGPTFASGSLFTARSATVRFNAVDMVLGRISVARSVKSVRLIEPHIFLDRTGNKHWSVEDLFQKKPALAAERFRGLILIESGAVTIADSATLLPKTPAINSVTGISGSMDFSPQQFAVIHLDGQGTGGRVHKLSASGNWGINSPTTNLTVSAQDGDASYWLRYFSRISSWTIARGRFTGSAVFTNLGGPAVIGRGMAHLHDASISSPHLRLPLANTSANIGFVGTSVTISGQGYLKSSPITISGRIPRFSPTLLDLSIESTHMDLSTLQSNIKALPLIPQFRWVGLGRIAGRVYGLSSSPTVTATLNAPQAVLYGTRITDIAAHGMYRNRAISVTSATGHIGEGSARISANIGLRPAPTRVQLSGTATNVDLSAVSVPRNLRISGLTNARFALTYSKGLRNGSVTAQIARGSVNGVTFQSSQANFSLSGPSTGIGTITATGGTAPGYAIKSATANLALSGRQITVARLAVNALQGSLTASGQATMDGRLNMRLAATNIDLSTLLMPLGYNFITGTSDFTGTLTGIVTNPRLAGAVTARNGSIRDIRYDLLQGTLAANRKNLVIENATIRRGPSEVATTGTITLARTGPVVLALQARAQQIDIAQVAQLIGMQGRASGMGTGTVRISGTLPNVQLSGDISVSNAVIGGIPADLIDVKLQSKGGRTLISELQAKRGAMRIYGNGSIGAKGQLQLNLTGEKLDLSLINRFTDPYIRMKGPVTFTASVGGSLTRPTFSGTIASTAPVINQQTFSSLAASVTWDGARLTLSNATLMQGASTYQVALARYNTSSLDMRASVVSGNIETIIGVLRNSSVIETARGNALRHFLDTLPSPMSGGFNSTISLSGPANNVSGNATLSASNVQLGNAKLTSIDIDIVKDPSSLQVRRVLVSAPGINIGGSAVFAGGQISSFTANTTDTQLSSIRSLILNMPILSSYDFGRRLLSAAKNSPSSIGGILNATASAANMQAAATGTITIAASGLSIPNAPTGDITANARIDGRTIIIDDLSVKAANEGMANLQGSITFDGLVSLTGKGTHLPLALARPWLGDRAVSGTIDFSFTANGQMSRPTLVAAFNIADFKSGPLSAQNISSPRITIANDRITTEGLTVVNQGSELLVSGFAPFVWTAPFISPDKPLQLNLHLNNQDLSIAQSWSTVVEKSSGPISANLQMTGTVNEPVLNGEINLTNGFLKLRQFGNSFTNINLALRIQNSVLNIDNFTGDSSLGGSFSMDGNVRFTGISTGLITAFLSLDSLKIQTTNLSGTAMENIALTANGQIAITEDLTAPLVQGQLVVRDAVVDIPANVVPTTLEMPVLPVVPRLDVTLNLAQNVMVRRGGLVATVVGPVTISGTGAAPIIAGTVQIASGRITYAGRSLDFVQGGTASFVLQPPKPAVITVNVQGRTRATAASAITGRLTRYTITVNLSGPIGDLNVDVLSSPPGLSRTEALALVFGGSALEALLRGQAFQDIFQQQIGQVLLGLALPGLFQPFELGGLTLTFETGFDIPLQITASTLLSDNISLSYSRSLIGNIPIDTLSFNYMINSNLGVSAQLEEQSGTPNDTIFLMEYSTRF